MIAGHQWGERRWRRNATRENDFVSADGDEQHGRRVDAHFFEIEDRRQMAGIAKTIDRDFFPDQLFR